MAKHPWVPLGLRSYFSLGRGLLSPEQISQWTSHHGLPGVGMADWNNFYGLVRFLTACKDQGVQALAGVVLAPEGQPILQAWCMDRRGFARINQILSSILDGEMGRQELLEDLSQGGWEGLVLVFRDWDVAESLWERRHQGLFGAVMAGTPFRPFAQECRRRGVPLLAVGDWVTPDHQDRDFYALLRAMSRNIVVENLEEEEQLQEHQVLPGARDAMAHLEPWPEALENARRLLFQAKTEELIPQSFVFPAFQGLSESQAFTRLQGLCHQGAQKRYGGITEEVRQRLDYELSIIRRKGFASYFLVVHDVVSRYPRTCGRGSSAASIVSYLLEITHVDPLKYNLFFERFLNEGRIDPPDIDVDFPWDEREKALAYVFQAYPGRSAMVADHVTYAHRSTLREPAKAYGLDKSEIDRLMDFFNRGELGEIPDYLLRAAGRLKGMPQHLGTHPGGVVITPGSIYQHTHIQTSPLGWPVIAWEKDAAEEAGLVKIDLLGNRSLAVLRDSLELIGKKRRKPIHWASFQPYEDEQTVELIESGDTLGVFYVESPATRQLLQKMGTGDYEHLVVASSIIRPAANKFIELYVRRLRGASWTPLDPDLERTLEETKGIMVYQEDVSRVAIAVADFTPAEADGLRKVLSKKHKLRKLQDYRERFFRGGLNRGRREGVLEKIWNMILSFAGYSFNKPHSASYALVSMRLAFVKRHYPLEFFVSVINNGGGFYSRQVYINAVKRRGFPVLPPDINASDGSYSIEGAALRVGLYQIGDLENRMVQRILEERREGGNYVSLEDFLLRVQPRLAHMRPLIRAGVLDSIAGCFNRPQMFWVFYHAQKNSLFTSLPKAPESIKDYPRGLKYRDELNILSLLVSQFPLDLFKSRVSPARARLINPKVPLIDSRMLEGVLGRRVCLAGLLVTRKFVRTKDRQAMSFISFEDAYGMVEAVAFPDQWERLSRILEEGMAFLASGLVTESLGAYMLELDDLVGLSRPVRESPPLASRRAL